MSARQGPAFAGLLIAVLCWSGNALVGRAFHDSIPPLSLSFWRWVLATSLLLLSSPRASGRTAPPACRRLALAGARRHGHRQLQLAALYRRAKHRGDQLTR